MSFQTYISPSAGRVVIVHGAHITFFDADDPENIHEATRISLAWLLPGVSDIQYFESLSSIDDARQTLLTLWRKDRALRVLQISLDPLLNPSHKSEAEELLEELLTDDGIRQYVRNVALSCANADVLQKSISIERPHTAKLLAELLDCQEAIGAVHLAFEAIPDIQFENSAHRATFLLEAITSGAFAELVVAAKSKDTIDAALFGLYKLLAQQKNFRSVINSWTSEFKIAATKRRIFRSSEITEADEADEEDRSLHNGPVHKIITNVIAQKKRVIERLAARDLNAASKYLEALVRDQLQRDEAHFAVKSLCDLANRAQDYGYEDLAETWLKRAVSINEKDSWSHGQLADYYIAQRNFELARQAYEKTREAGDILHAENGLARILRDTGRLDEAIAAFSKLTVDFADHALAHRVWVNLSASLRDRWRHEEAIAVAKDGKDRFPNEAATWSALGAALESGGRLDDAIAIYREAQARFPDNEYAIVGLADTLKQIGDFKSALEVLEEAEERFSWSPVVAAVKADTQRVAGNLDAALSLYREGKTRFRGYPALASGYAHTLSDMGRRKEAVAAYREAVAQFPHERRSLTGLAGALRLSGNLVEALANYDKAASDFPLDPYALNGRAKVLKELAQYDAALSAYDDLITRYPTFEYARYGKASVFAIIGKYEEALELLPTVKPVTKESWMGWHVKGMLLLKKGRFQDALDVMSLGAKYCPYAHDRSLFNSGLAFIQMRKGKLQDALHTARQTRELATIDEGRPINQLILAHIFLALEKPAHARAILRAVNDNFAPTVQAIKNDLEALCKRPGGVYLDFSKTRRLLKREEDLLLQAA